MPIGKCKMCLHEKMLVRSHLMPAALYDYCRKGEHRPIKVGMGFVVPTDRQTQDYLLCEDCEDVLNSGGERWILDKLATWERTFPLYDVLTKVPPLFDEDGMVVYLAGQNPEIAVEKLTHFALGLFWKASVHSWMGIRAILASIWARIGKKYGSGFEAKTHFPNTSTSSSWWKNRRRLRSR